MSENYKYKNRTLQIGLKISYYRKLVGLTQDDLAERINKTPGYIAQIEAPGVSTGISLATLFDIADVLGIEPYKLLIFD